MFIDKRQQNYTSSIGATCLRLHTCRPYGAGVSWKRYIYKHDTPTGSGKYPAAATAQTYYPFNSSNFIGLLLHNFCLFRSSINRRHPHCKYKPLAPGVALSHTHAIAL